MTDLDRARAALPGHTLALCRGGEVVTSDRRGVMPMLGFLREGRDLSGFCAADRVVGRAAAMLFAKAGVRAVFAEVMSDGAVALLAAHGIDASCDVRTAAIENRQKTGLCPMESAVAGIEDIDAGIAAICRRAEELRAGH